MGDKVEFEGKKYRLNGIEMNLVIEGQGSDLLVVHGFPDSIAVWRHQIPALVAAGYRVIVPDQRGFGLTEAPGETKAYAIENYVADLAALLDALGLKKVLLVGHDWGAAVCWQFCMRHPERVDRYVAVSVGHPTAYAKGSFKQKIKAYYIIFFQIKGLSEWMVTRADWWLWRKMIRYDPEFKRWKAQLSRPGRLTAAINIYRANLKLRRSHNWPKVTVPVMGVWGEGDVALAEEQMIASEKYVSASWRYERIGERSGHWLMLSATDKFNAVLLDYLKADVSAKPRTNSSPH
jgi:pimeloyl-ACP methyl ester carboxylesterase